MVHIDITDIRYRFTPCGVAGRNGPAYGTCSEFYSREGSRQAQEGMLVEPETGQYRHAQIFRVPRFGLYNVTAAGASGGRGVCNGERGYGTARTVQVELYFNLTLLVLVGQHGASFCDVEPGSSPCNVAESSSCNDTWHSYIGEHGGGSALVGGGGGGGASLLRAFTPRGFDDDPIVVGGGGGGSSALLYHGVIEELGVDTTGLSPAPAYQRYINADGVGGEEEPPGWMRNSTITAGVGGGYGRGGGQLDTDGGRLDDPVEFAVGGHPCGMADREMNGTFGGFGGGGGGCAGGGGGGGYMGGRVAGLGPLIPGSGGTSFSGSPLGTSFKSILFMSDFLNTHFEDGYVDIVHADCECIYRCIVYSEQDMFECTCPGESTLAADDSDCYFGEYISCDCRE
jgi:hypothetical protein